MDNQQDLEESVVIESLKGTQNDNPQTAKLAILVLHLYVSWKSLFENHEDKKQGQSAADREESSREARQ